MNDAVRLYLRHLPAITRLIDRMGMGFYYHNPLFYLSHLTKAKPWKIEELDGALCMDAGEWCSILPIIPDRQRYIAAVRASVRSGRPVLRLPQWIEPHLYGFLIAELWPDYVGSTVELAHMSGNRLKGLRQPIQRVERSGRAQVYRMPPEEAQEAVALVRTWYELRAPILGEMFQEVEITWLFRNIGWLMQHVPGTFAMAVRVDGQLVAVNISTVLSETIWICHTERYDPRSLTYVNQLAFRDACRQPEVAALPWINDGAAEVQEMPGVANLASFKRRLSDHTLTPLGAWKDRIG